MDLKDALAKTGAMNIASALILHFVENDRPFSSGEIAAYIREHCPNERFSVTTLGEKIRDMFDSGSMPEYASGYAVRTPRTTTGTARTLEGDVVPSRTPYGTTVFVYAPDAQTGEGYDFEIAIPGVPASATAPQSPTMPAPVPSTSPSDCGLTYLTGGRLYLPKRALDSLLAATGTSLRGGANGDPVWVTIADQEIRVTVTDPGPAAPGERVSALKPWAGRGRIAISCVPWADEADGEHEISLRGDTLVVKRS